MNLTIRMNASTDEVILNGHRFDRSGLTRRERDTMARMVCDALVADGTIEDHSHRSRRPRRSAPRRQV